MVYLRDELKMKKSNRVFTVRLDDETIKNIDILAEYFNIKKGELIKLGLLNINVKETKNRLLKDSEDKMKLLC